MKVAVAFSKQQLCPRVCKSTTLSRIDFMPLSVDKFLVSKFESIGMFSGFFSAVQIGPTKTAPLLINTIEMRVL